MRICCRYIELVEIEVEPCSDREKNLEGFETYDQGIEVSLVIINSRDLGETSRYERCLVLNKDAVLELQVGRSIVG